MGLSIITCAPSELQWREDDVLVIHLAVVDELEGGEVIVNLPEQIGEGEQDDESDADDRAAGEDDARVQA